MKTWEVTVNPVSSTTVVGVGTSRAALSDYVGASIYGWGYLGSGNKVHTGLQNSCGDALQNGDSVQVALNPDTGELWFGVNGVWQGGGSPSLGTSPAFTGVFGTLYLMWSPAYISEACTIDWANAEFTTLKAHICCEEATGQGVVIEGLNKQSVIEIHSIPDEEKIIATDEISAPIRALDGSPATHRVEAKLAPRYSEEFPWQPCYENVEDEIWVSREIAGSNPDFSMTPGDVWERYPQINADLPRDCKWVRTDIVEIEPTVWATPSIYASYIPGGGGPITEDGSTLFDGPDVWEIPMTQLDVVPGQALCLQETYEDSDAIWVLQYADDCWFDTAVYSGGIVLDAYTWWGYRGKYHVSWHGFTIDIWSSDRIVWEDDDWVVLVRVNDADTCESRSGMPPDKWDRPDDPNEGVRAQNDWREEHGFKPFTFSESCQAAAQRHANDMAKNDLWSHEGSDGTRVFARLLDTGYGGASGAFACSENLYKDNGFEEISDAESAVKAWANSPDHRNNMTASYTSCGVASATSDSGVTYWCAVYARINGIDENNAGWVMTPFRMNGVGA